MTKPLNESIRVLLVNVSEYRPKRIYREYPLGLGYIGTILSNAGAEVRLLDLGLDTRPIMSLLSDFNPTLVGFSFLSTSWPLARQLVRELRKSFDGPTMAGGIHASLFPEDVLRAGFDVVLRGEGENAIVRMVQALLEGEESLRSIPGAAFLAENELHCNSETESVTRLDTLPIVDRDLYDLSLYDHHSVMTSRGCPHSCKFCCNWGAGLPKCRSRSPADVVEEMQYLVNRYEAKLVYFADDLFFFSKSRRQEFCELVGRSGLDVEWVAQLRVDSVDRELLSAMKRAGCVKVCFGVESGDQEILDSSGKNITVEQIRAAIIEAHQVDLKIKTWWILGLPGNFEQQLASLDLMLELMPHEISIHPLVPLPGSEYWRHSERHGIHIRDREDFGSLFYDTIPNNIRMDYLSIEELADLFHIFIDRLKRAGYVTTDEAGEGDELLIATPFQGTGFRV